MRDKTWTEREVRQPRKPWTPETRQQVRDLLEEALRLIETTGLAPEVAGELHAAIRELDALPG